jgi:hypothetical protein
VSERDIELPDPERPVLERAPGWPLVEITGGPHGKNTQLKVDGKVIPKVHRVDLSLSVNDVVRLTTYQFVQAMVELETRGVEDGGYIASIELREYMDLGEITALDPNKTQIVEGRGLTRRQALLDAIEHLPEDA